MLDRRYLSCTLTVTEINNTDNYVIYEFEPQDISFNPSTNILTMVPSSVYASPLVNASGLVSGDQACLTFDLFRGEKSKSEAGVNGTEDNWYDLPQSEFDGAVYEYVVKRTDTGNEGVRTGQIFAAWQGSTNVQFTDTSTRDAGGVTSGLSFSVKVNGTTAALGVNVSTGTYTVIVNVRPYGHYS